MTALYVYDDAAARRFEPFVLTRPAGELRAGARLLRERWEGAFARRAAGLLAAPQLRDFDEPWAPPVVAADIPAGAIVANARCAVALDARADRDADVWRCGGRVAAVRLERALPAGALADGALALDALVPPAARAEELAGVWVDHVWQLVSELPALLTEDVAALARAPGLETTTPPEPILVGGGQVTVEAGAVVEPHVCFDTSEGPIFVSRGARVRAFTRLEGPCFIGRDAIIFGDVVAGCSIGEVCKVRGQMANTVVLGHSNKAHEGFVGHSYLGRWVNIGAGTITSNLKNTYSTVDLWTPEGMRETGLQFLGTFFGDHAKTGISLRLTTGTVIGTGANVFGSNVPPKHVPAFAWGDRAPFAEFQLDKFVEVAERMMARRHVALSERGARLLAAAFAGRGASGR